MSNKIIYKSANDISNRTIKLSSLISTLLKKGCSRDLIWNIVRLMIALISR
jgi:hypothetical protein